MSYTVSRAGGVSRIDIGAARHCRGRELKIARTMDNTALYLSRDLPYMVTARRHSTHAHDAELYSFHRSPGTPGPTHGQSVKDASPTFIRGGESGRR
jgi:hypothetical protein